MGENFKNDREAMLNRLWAKIPQWLQSVLLCFIILASIVLAIRQLLPVLLSATNHDKEFNPPNLEARLIVDSSTSEEFSFHFEIENNGKAPAENLNLIFRSSGFSHGEMPGERFEKELDPGGIMNYDPYPLVRGMPLEGKYLKLDLIALFSFKENGASKEYFTIFNFNIKRSKFDQKVFLYNSKITKQGGFDIKSRIELMGTKDVLDKDEGAFYLWFNPHEQNRSGISSLIKGKDKELLYSPQDEAVVLKLMNDNLNDKILFQKLARYFPSDNHFVAITWGFGFVRLYVDCSGLELKGDGPPKVIERGADEYCQGPE